MRARRYQRAPVCVMEKRGDRLGLEGRFHGILKNLFRIQLVGCR